MYYMISELLNGKVLVLYDAIAQNDYDRATALFREGAAESAYCLLVDAADEDQPVGEMPAAADKLLAWGSLRPHVKYRIFKRA